MSDNSRESLKYKNLIVAAGLIIAGGAFGFGIISSASGQTQDPKVANQNALTPQTTLRQTTIDAAAAEKAKLVEAQRQQAAADEKAKLADAQRQQTTANPVTNTDTSQNSATTTPSKDVRPITHVANKAVFTPMLAPKNILLRKALPPSTVQWQVAMAARDKMKTARTTNSLAMRLPKQELDRTRLPVVMPREGGVINTGKARLMSFGDAYAMDLPQPKGAHFAVYGNRSFVKGDQGAITAKPFAKVQGVVENVQISRMEDGWTATFTRYGVVYSLDMMCDDIESADCSTDAPIRKAIADLTDVTMGAEAESEAQQSLAPTAKPNWFDKTVKDVTKSVNGLVGGKS